MKKILITTLIILGFTSAGFCQRYFLKIETPNVNGKSTDPNHMNEILLEDFNFEIMNEINIGSQSGGVGAGKAQSGPINLKFELSKDINTLFHALHSGQIFTRFTITANNGTVDYLKYEFKNVVISQFGTANSGDHEKLYASLTCKSGTYKLTYIPLNGAGVPQTAIEVMWSFIKNNESEGVN